MSSFDPYYSAKHPKLNVAESSLLNNMEEAYKTGYGCDIDVHVGGRKFKASKRMLRAKSSVFRAMFSHETKENQTNSVTINGFDVDVVEHFLCYLHTGKLPALYTERMKFLLIADYYDVKQLKEICLNAIISSLRPTNAQEYFKIADQFNLVDLKAKTLNVMTKDLRSETFYSYLEFARSSQSKELETIVIKFIEANMWKLCRLPDWKKLDPELRAQLFERRLQILDFDLKPVLGGKLMLDVDCSRVAMWNGTYHSKTLVLKNTGSMRLVYRMSPASVYQLFNAGQNFSISPELGFIVPGQDQHVNIRYSFQARIDLDYQATTKTDINQCFQNNSFCRKIVLNLT